MWDRLAQARDQDPGGVAVVEIADEVLAGDAPVSVKLAALRAKADHAYLNGDDVAAIDWAEQGLVLAPPSDPATATRVVIDLARIRARGVVRGGDPDAALAAVEHPMALAGDGWAPDEELGLRAVAADRRGDGPAAVQALARWREALSDDQPSALWAEHRLALIANGLPPAQLSEVAAEMPESAAKACLLARGGEPVPSAMPAWVAGCATASGHIGILLPRSGPLAAFADAQLAAAMATVEVVALTGPVPPLAWHDSGSSAKSARSAARALVADGARVLVGPIGARNVEAVAKEVESSAAVIVPGEGRGTATGVAPSLELRIRALVDQAQAGARDRIVVLAPDSSYGRRAVKAVQAHAEGKFEKPLVVRNYPPKTTTFGPHVNPVMTALRSETALLVPDTLVRTEMLVRQLARSGRMPAHDDVPGLMVLTTAEGVDPQGLSDAHDVLEGVWVVPAAARGPQLDAFEHAYAQLQGSPPGDQALLLFYALQQALLGRPGPAAGTATLTRVQGGRLVVQSSQAGPS